MTGDFVTEFDKITHLVWGKISLIDLYLGFIVIGIIILAFEPFYIGLPVVIVLFIFGNWVALFWLAARLAQSRPQNARRSLTGLIRPA